MNLLNFSRARRRLRVAPVFVLSASAILTGLLPSIAAAPEIGLEFEGSRDLNRVKIVDTNFVGECPGDEAGTVQARFFSQAIPPAEGRRVVIRNTTRGLGGDPAPFSDREYSKGRNSEAATIAFGTRHELKTLNVIEGLNDFEYEIREGDRTVDRGTFSAEFERGERTRERSATCSNESYCARYVEKPTQIGKKIEVRQECVRHATRTTCSCPNGRVVQQFDSRDSWRW